MCRLSIIVPYDRDEAAFETTLVSVLENRPEHCEIIVAHDGGYNDPFDLGDEVRFAIAERNDRLSLIAAAVNMAMGRIVHVLCGGARATEDWTCEPLDLFEQSDLGCVAPVIRHLSADGSVIAVGWHDSQTGLRRPLAAGSGAPSRKELASVEGAYLEASFWRRSTLEQLISLPVDDSAGVTDYLWAACAKQAGWRCRVAAESTINASPNLVSPTVSAVRLAATRQQVRSQLRGEGLVGVMIASLLTVLVQPWRGSAWGEASGRLLSAAGLLACGRAMPAKIRRLAKEMGPDAAQATILRMPVSNDLPLRRAA